MLLHLEISRLVCIAFGFLPAGCLFLRTGASIAGTAVLLSGGTVVFLPIRSVILLTAGIITVFSVGSTIFLFIAFFPGIAVF